MCGRFSLSVNPEALAEQFRFPLTQRHQNLPPGRPPATSEASHMQPRYNIAPTQPVAVVRERAVDGTREMAHLLWGLIPSWAKEPSMGSRMINARAETVAEKPSFRMPLRRRRCLILADGFYEWVPTSQGKIPHYICRQDAQAFAFAGLWEHWMGPNGEEIESCTIITTAANGQMARIHKRMPVILEPEHHAQWLSRLEARPGDLQGLLESREWQGFAMRPVSTYVNNPRNEGPACIAHVS